MRLPLGGLLLLGGVALLLGGHSGSSSSHSLQYFLTRVSEPSPGLPKFFALGYVDNHLTDYYDSNTRRSVPRVPWLEEVEKDYPQFWNRKSGRLLHIELTLGANLELTKNCLNQSHDELHTLQALCGCPVVAEGQCSKRRFRFAYDGKDIIWFEEETHTWAASVPRGQVIKSMLETKGTLTQIDKDCLEECSLWLQRFLEYENKSLQRTEAPAVKVARKAGYDGRETLICRAHGFYPKEIEVTWMKDGEDQKPDTFTGGVIPNSDGTYHTWLSIEVDSQERDRYQCQVAHDGLPEPLDFTWEEPASDLGLILGLTVGLGFILVCLILCLTFAIKQQEMGYEMTPVSVPEVENNEGLLESSGGSISRDPDFHLPPDF